MIPFGPWPPAGLVSTDGKWSLRSCHPGRAQTVPAAGAPLRIKRAPTCENRKADITCLLTRQLQAIRGTHNHHRKQHLRSRGPSRGYVSSRWRDRGFRAPLKAFFSFNIHRRDARFLAPRRRAPRRLQNPAKRLKTCRLDKRAYAHKILLQQEIKTRHRLTRAEAPSDAGAVTNDPPGA